MASLHDFEKHNPNIVDQKTISEAQPWTANKAHLTRKLDISLGRPSRYLKSIPVIALGVTLVASWEATANGFQAGLYNGGPSSLVWGFLVAGPGTAMIVLSLAEMASITPSVGAQYRWVAIYCPSYLPRRFMSFFQSWLTVFAWIAAAALIPFFTGSQICGLLILNYPNYVYKGWHTTLVGFATVVVPLTFNIFARKTLKPIDLFGMVLHIVFFVIFVVVLISRGGRNSATYVFTGNSGGISGWRNPTIEWLIGLLSATFPLTAFDGVLHLSDEVKNPEIRLPRTMIISWAINAVTAFGFMIILLFFMGSPETAVDTPTGWPIIEICYQAAKQLSGANALMSMIIIPGIISYFNSMASVSRLTWAFARDDGFPFSGYFKVVHPMLHTPLRALAITTFVTMLLLLIPIGSEAAFEAIVSLTTLALYISYTIPCIFVFLQRLAGEHVDESPWSLGRAGIWINGIASIWGIFIIIWLCFPSELPVTAKTMNWAGPIVGFVVIFSLLDWLFRGCHQFKVPVEKRIDEDYYVAEESQSQ